MAWQFMQFGFELFHFCLMCTRCLSPEALGPYTINDKNTCLGDTALPAAQLADEMISRQGKTWRHRVTEISCDKSSTEGICSTLHRIIKRLRRMYEQRIICAYVCIQNYMHLCRYALVYMHNISFNKRWTSIPPNSLCPVYQRDPLRSIQTCDAI